MKILYVLEYFYPHIGGVETLFKSLTEKVVEQGHTVTIITNKYDKQLTSTETINGVTIKRYPFRNRYLFTFLALIPAIKEAWRHDIIHTTSYNAGFPSFFAGFISRTKVIITFHEVWKDIWHDLPFMGRVTRVLHSWFESLLLALPFASFVAVSESTKQALLKAGVSSHQVTRIYNGLDYDLSPPRNEANDSSDSFNFYYFGRLGVSKGIDVLMQAMLILKGTATRSFGLNLIIPKEENPIFDYVRKTIRDNGLDPIITIKHELTTEELQDELRKKANAVVIPSFSEGFGFSAAEASALGVAIISSGRGSLPEVVSGKYSEFSPYSGEGLANTMKEVLEDKWEYNHSLKQFSLDDSVSQYIDLYHKLYTR